MRLAVVCWRPAAIGGRPAYDAAFGGTGVVVPAHIPMGNAIGICNLRVHLGANWVLAFMPLGIQGSTARDFSSASPDFYFEAGEQIRASLNAFLTAQNFPAPQVLDALLVGMHISHDYKTESSRLADGLAGLQPGLFFVDARYSNDEPPTNHDPHDLGVSPRRVFGYLEAAVAPGANVDNEIQQVYDGAITGELNSCIRHAL